MTMANVLNVVGNLSMAKRIGKNLIVAIVDRNYIGLKVRIRNETDN